MTTPPSPPPHRISAHSLELLHQYGRRIELPAGQILFNVGDPGASMYIIDRGRVDLLFKGGKSSKALGPGESFGELAFFLGDQPRTATAVIGEDATLHQLGQCEFATLFEHEPQLFFGILRDACRYLLQSEQGLIRTMVQRNRELEQALDYLRRTKRELSTDESATLIDPATGLYNLRFLFRQLKQRPETGAGCAPPALLLIELEGLPGLERNYGPLFRDQLLRRAAVAIRERIGRHDFPCTIASGRFAILAAECDPAKEHHRTLGDQLHQTLLALVRNLPGKTQPLDIALGTALWRPDESGETMFHRAGEYLAKAKQPAGPRQVVEGQSAG